MSDETNEQVASEPPFNFEKAAPLLVALLVVLVFVPLVRYEFLSWDDDDTIALNPHLNPATPQSIAYYWTNTHMDMYAPLTYTMWGLVTLVARVEQPDPAGITLNPMIFHMLNLLLHAASAVVVMQVLRMLVPGALWAATVGAALWAVHPLQVETVAWISGGKDLLSGLLGLIALWQYLRYARGLDDQDQTSRPIVAFVIATIFFGLAMLAKPSAVVLPLMAAVLDWLVIGRPLRRIVPPLVIWVLLCVPIIFIGYISQANAQYVDSPLWFRPVVALDALAFYLFKLVFPWQLAPDYGRAPSALMHSSARYWTWMVPVVVAILCWLLRHRLPRLPAAFVLMVAALLPVLGLIRFDFQIYSTVADHYMYLAMLAPALLATSLLSRRDLPIEPPELALRDRWLQVVLVILGLLAIRSFVQTWNWRDTPTLFAHTLSVNPQSIAANNSLGTYLAEQAEQARTAAQQAAASNDLATAQRLAQMAAQLDHTAIEHYRTSLAVRPNDPAIRFNLANKLLMTDPAEAITHYQRAIELNPDEPIIHNNLSIALLQLERNAEAADAARAALALNEQFPLAHTNLGIALRRLGELDSARRHFGRALELNPHSAVAQRHLREMSEAPTTSTAPTEPATQDVDQPEAPPASP